MKAYISSAIAIFSFLFCTTISPAHAQTADPPEDPPIGILLAAGDISTCGNYKWHRYADRTAELIRKVVEKAQSDQPSVPVRVLALGDLAYDQGTVPELACFAKRWNGFDDILRPVPGNHDYKAPGAEPYFEHFAGNKFVQQNGEQKGYFTENFPREDGPWLLIGLNSHIRKSAKAGQLKWLETQLGDASPCVLAFWHAPTFSSGRHGHGYKTEPNAPLTNKKPMHDALRALYKHGASVVLAGHDHDYEQFKRHDADGNEAKDDGIRSCVVGTGGSLLTEDHYSNTWPISEGLYGKTKLGKGNQGVLKIVLYERRYEWDFLSIDDTKTLHLKTKKDDCITRKTPQP